MDQSCGCNYDDLIRMVLMRSVMVSGDLQLPASSWLSSMDHGALPATPDDHFYQVK